ncbi:MAG TPA: hypothetical protein PKG48_09450 [Bacteroidales bacterium]|nr:hypothetical protein [Bacteroidales bacterium]HPS62601.1 hypothetical protein [Bacteroidales bacterium]
MRIRIGQYYYRRETTRSERRSQMTNLDDARRIGILYTLDDMPDYERVSEFVSRLQNDHKEVKALGFVKNRNLLQRFLPKLSFDFFSKRDLTWFYKPIHSQVKDFIEKEFDLLIDLSMQDTFPLKYISGLSRALCRVGKFSEDNTQYYDLMIDTKPSMTQEEYMKQVQHYLTVIKTHAKRS